MKEPLLSLRARLEEYRATTSFPWEEIERDYALSVILGCIASIPELQKTLIFKGGTALKKCYFGAYRFSQDLDFSATEGVPEALFQYVEEVCKRATERLQNRGENAHFCCARYTEKAPHPEKQQAFTVKVRLPWHRDWGTRIMLEVTMQEPILAEPQTLPILASYGEVFEAPIRVYSLEEIMAEKIRAILQLEKKLHERGWGRSRVRDYYDLWRILNEFGSHLDLTVIKSLVEQKCLLKGIVWAGVESLFSDRLMSLLARDWRTWLKSVVFETPERENVIRELKEKLEEILG